VPFPATKPETKHILYHMWSYPKLKENKIKSYFESAHQVNMFYFIIFEEKVNFYVFKMEDLKINPQQTNSGFNIFIKSTTVG
jgi:hypothetical protein